MKKSFIVLTVLALICLTSAVYAADAPAWKEKVAAEIAAAQFDVGVYVLDVANNDKFEHNANKVFSSASVIKLFILQELFNQVKSGEVKLSDAVIYDQSKSVPGGMLHKFSSGAILRLEDLALFMLSVSDNTATNILIDKLGIDRINATIQALGAKDSILGRKMLDFEARKAGKDNYTTAAEIGSLLTGFLKEDPRILDMLSLQKDRSKLAANLGFDDADELEPIIATKSGELPGFYHDSGIFFYATPRPVVIVVMTGGVPTLVTGCDFIARIGKILYDAFLVK